jgi:hypothetical protein
MQLGILAYLDCAAATFIALSGPALFRKRPNRITIASPPRLRP